MENEFDKSFVKKINEYNVYLIDDFKFRNKSLELEEFGTFGTSIDFTEIPLREIWISKYAQERERDLFIENAFKQLEMTTQGVERVNAFDTAIVLEKNLRMKINDSTKNSLKQVYAGTYQSYFWQRFKIQLVDGNIVRNLYRTDFYKGGHGYVNPFIPRNEIWIEKDLNPDELPLIALHEFLSRFLMKENNERYAYAHQVASKVEFAFRPDKFKKADLNSLNPNKARELISEYNR